MNRFFKKAFAAVFALSTVMSAAVMPLTADAAALGKEIFPDGGFENAEVGAYSVPLGSGVRIELSAGISAAVTDTVNANGKKSLMLNAATDKAQGLNIYFPATAGKVYVLSAKTRTDAQTNEQFKIATDLETGSVWSGKDARSDNRNFDISRGWTEVALAVKASATKSNARAFLMLPYTSTAYPNIKYVYIDDLSIMEYTEAEYEAAQLRSKLVYGENFSALGEGTIPSVNGYAAEDGGAISVAAVTDRSGDGKAAEIVLSKASGRFCKKDFAVENGKDYRFSAWVKPKADNSGDIKMYTKIWGSGLTTADSFTKTLAPGSDWVRMDTYIHAADIAEYVNGVKFYFYTTGTAGDSLYIDDVTITAVDIADNAVSYNPGFELSEDGDSFANQLSNAQGNDFYVTGAAAKVVTDEVYGGLKSVRLTKDSTDNASTIYQNVPMTNGKVYEISAMVKAANGPISFYMLGGDWGHRYNSETITSDGKWHKLSYIMTADYDSAVKTIRLAMNGGSAYAGREYYVDDFCVREVTDGENKEIAGNLIAAQASDFEKSDLSMLTPGSGTTLSADFTLAHTGVRSLKASATASPSFTVSDITLEAGKEYVFGAYIGSTEASNSIDITVVDAGGEPIIRTSEAAFNTGALNYTSFTFTAKQSGVAELEVMGKKTFSIDSLFIKETAAYTEIEGNIFTNGSFEGDILSAFADSRIADSANGTKVSITGDYAAGGNNSLMAQQTTAGGSFVIEVPAAAGKQYKVSLDARWDEEKTDYNSIYIRKYEPDAVLVNTGDISGADGWKHIECYVPALANGNIKLQIKGNNKATEKYYIDNISITEYNPKFTVDSDTLTYSADGTAYTPASRGDVKDGSYKYTAIFSNPTQTAKNIMLTAAAYNADGSLAAVGTSAESVAAGAESKDISAVFGISGAAAGMYIKTFIWDKDTLEPLDKDEIKVLIIGNSITQHDLDASKGWLGNWGMAATAEDKDYVHLLKSAIDSEYDNVVFKWKNISDFEKYFYDFSEIDTARFDDLVSYDADIIIAAFGANIKNSQNEGDSGFETENTFAAEHYKNIIDHFNPNGDAQVIAGITTLTSADNIAVIKAAAESNGYSVVDMSALTATEYTAENYKSASVFGANVISGVLSHPGDLGMQEMVSRLLPALKNAVEAR